MNIVFRKNVNSDADFIFDFADNGVLVPNGIKNWLALITQATTAAPTASILENSLGGTITIGRTSAGIYTFTLTGAFTANKTIVRPSRGFLVDDAGAQTSFKFVRTSANVITMTCLDNAGVAKDLLSADLLIQFIVYPA